MSALPDLIERPRLFVVNDTPFVRLPVSVLKRGDLSSWARLLAALLLDYRSDDQGCFPGQARLAADLGTSVDTIGRALNELQRAGLIVRQRRGRGHTNAYDLRFDSAPVRNQRKDDAAVVRIQPVDDSAPVRNLESAPVRNKQDLVEPENNETTATQSAAKPPVPLWESFVTDYRAEKNKPAAIGRFYEAVIGRAPDYARFAKMLKEAGSGEAVGKAILEASAHHHTDDPLDYIHATLKRTGRRGGSSPDGVDWSKYQGDGYLAVRGRVD